MSYIYDANGHKVAMSDASGTSSFACDPFGELTSATNGAHQMAAYADNADAQSLATRGFCGLHHTARPPISLTPPFPYHG